MAAPFTVPEREACLFSLCSNKIGEGGGAYDPTTGQIAYLLDPNGNPVDHASGDPIANLELVPSIFFAHPGVTLGKKKVVLSQAQLFHPFHPSDGKYVENVMFVDAQVMFVTINLPGGSNNDTDVWYAAPTATAAQLAEADERTGADLRWLALAFAIARIGHLEGVVIQAQADMWDPEKGAAHQAAFEPFARNLAQNTTTFERPVLMFNGDSHVYQSSNPLSPVDALSYIHPGYDVPNFHRVVVHGSTTPLEWLKLTVDPRATAPEGPNAFGHFA